MPPTSPTQFSNVSVGVSGSDRERLSGLLALALSLVVDLVPEPERARPRQIGEKVSAKSLDLAASGALQSVNALMASLAVKCNRVPPPEDIDMKMTAGGTIIYRCYHSPAHEWDLSGNPRP